MKKELSLQQEADLRAKLRVATDRLIARANVLLRHLGGKQPLKADAVASALLRVAAASHKLTVAEELLRPPVGKVVQA